MSKLNGIVRNPVKWTIRYTEDSGARSWCPTLVIGETRRQSTCWPVASGSSSSTGSRNLKCCWCCDCSHCLLQETQSHCGKSSLAGHQSHQSQRQSAQQRKWIDSLCERCISFNKIIKLKNNQIILKNSHINY